MRLIHVADPSSECDFLRGRVIAMGCSEPAGGGGPGEARSPGSQAAGAWPWLPSAAQAPPRPMRLHSEPACTAQAAPAPFCIMDKRDHDGLSSAT